MICMSNNNRLQRGIIRHGTIEACRTAMEDLIDHACDLESVGLVKEGDALREVAGHIENFIISMSKPWSPRS